jgi:hypothetical protein
MRLKLPRPGKVFKISLRKNLARITRRVTFVKQSQTKTDKMTNEIVLPVGTKIKRVSNGATGEVIEDNEQFRADTIAKGFTPEHSRRRIKWDGGGQRTWIAIKDLVKLPA